MHTPQNFSSRVGPAAGAGRVSAGLVLLLSLAAVVVAAGLIVARLVPDDATLAQRLAQRLQKALGVPVTVGSVHWQLLPHAQVTVTDVVAAPTREQVSAAIARRAAEARKDATHAPGPAAASEVPAVPADAAELTARVGTITLYPQLLPLLHHEIAFDRITVEDAQLPQLLLTALGDAGKDTGKNNEKAGDTSSDKSSQNASKWRPAPLPLARFELRKLVWIGRHGKALPYAAAIDFDAGWRPRHAEVERSGAEPKAQLVLDRQEGQDRWSVKTTIAGGSLDGSVALQAPAAAASTDAGAAGAAKTAGWQLSGDLVPKNIDIVRLMQTFDHQSVVGGTLTGSLHLEAHAAAPSGLLGALVTQTRFRIAPATLLHFDLDKAIHSLGQQHEGTTHLEVLEGRLETRSAPLGTVLHYTDLHATAGKLSARGEASLQDRHIDARFAVDLVDGLVGVPLTVSGTTAHPSYSVPAGALAGAVAGTAALPGIGTAIGARIGGLIDRVFGGGDKGGGTTGSKAPIGPTPPPTTRP